MAEKGEKEITGERKWKEWKREMEIIDRGKGDNKQREKEDSRKREMRSKKRGN